MNLFPHQRTVWIYLAAVLWASLPSGLKSEAASGFVPVEGGQLYYEAAGNGETVVLIHAHSVDLRMWDFQFSELAKRFRVIRYDLRGYGRSSLPRDGEAFTHAQDLRQLFDFLDVTRAHLVGLSLGAFVAGDFMVLHPERTLSATVASGGVHNGPGTTLTAAQRENRLREIAALENRGLAAFKREWMDAMMRASGPSREEIRAPLWRMIEAWTAWQPQHVEVASLLGETILPRLAEKPNRVPLQIIMAENDSEGSRHSSQRLADAIPGAKVTRIAEAGHWSSLEQPEAFTTAVLSFITAVSRPPTFCNPLDLPYRFQEPNGNYRSAADPAVVFFQNAYWLFASRSGGYWRSTDLLHWTFIAASGYPLDIWAPTPAVVNGKLYLTLGAKAGTFTTDDPASGRWTNVTSYDRVVEDPMVLQDTDGRVYLYDGCSNVNPLRVLELDPKTFQPISAIVSTLQADTKNHGWEVPGDTNRSRDAKPWIEGSWVNKINGRYYLQYSGPGTQFKTYGDGVYVADKPTGPFVYAPYSPFSFKPTGFITGPGHSTTFADTRGQLWHMSCLTISKRNIFERRLGLFPTGVLPDGQLVTQTYLGDYPQFAPGVTANPLKENSPRWMLLSYGKTATASSTLPNTAKQDFAVANAFDEDVRTWWSAATGDAGEWLQVDLGKMCRVESLQINFADQDAVSKDYLGPHAYRYHVEASSDAKTWTTIVDRREGGRDAPHDYVQLEAPTTARYLRITNAHMPAGGRFSLYDLRVFGSGLGQPPPEVKQFEVTRDAADPRSARVSWPAGANTDFYIVRYGVAPDRLFGNYQVYRANSIEINALNVGVDYCFTVDAVNDTAITPGRTTLRR